MLTLQKSHGYPIPRAPHSTPCITPPPPPTDHHTPHHPPTLLDRGPQLSRRRLLLLQRRLGGSQLPLQLARPAPGGGQRQTNEPHRGPGSSNTGGAGAHGPAAEHPGRLPRLTAACHYLQQQPGLSMAPRQSRTASHQACFSRPKHPTSTQPKNGMHTCPPTHPPTCGWPPSAPAPRPGHPRPPAGCLPAAAPAPAREWKGGRGGASRSGRERQGLWGPPIPWCAPGSPPGGCLGGQQAEMRGGSSWQAPGEAAARMPLAHAACAAPVQRLTPWKPSPQSVAALRRLV